MEKCYLEPIFDLIKIKTFQNYLEVGETQKYGLEPNPYQII